MFLAEWNICFEQNWKHLLLWKTGGKLGSITFEYEFNHWSRKALSCIFESCPLGESFWKEFEINKNYDNTIRWHNVLLFEITHVDYDDMDIFRSWSSFHKSCSKFCGGYILFPSFSSKILLGRANSFSIWTQKFEENLFVLTWRSSLPRRWRLKQNS